MRILSKFRDYYDGVANTGVDMSVFFNRSQFESEHNKIDYAFSENIKSFNLGSIGRFDFDVEYFYVIFCGVVYPGIAIERRPQYISAKYIEPKTDYIYSYEDALKNKAISNTRHDKRRQFRWVQKNKVGKKYLSNHFSFKKNMDYFNRMAENKTPIIMFRRSHCGTVIVATVNPCLRDVKFYKVFDTYSAFQELSMFIGGVMSSHKTGAVTISDSDMAVKKGFNSMSFKTYSPGKKRRRRGSSLG